MDHERLEQMIHVCSVELFCSRTIVAREQPGAFLHLYECSWQAGRPAPVSGSQSCTLSLQEHSAWCPKAYDKGCTGQAPCNCTAGGQGDSIPPALVGFWNPWIPSSPYPTQYLLLLPSLSYIRACGWRGGQTGLSSELFHLQIVALVAHMHL